MSTILIALIGAGYVMCYMGGYLAGSRKRVRAAARMYRLLLAARDHETQAGLHVDNDDLPRPPLRAVEQPARGATYRFGHRDNNGGAA